MLMHTPGVLSGQACSARIDGGGQLRKIPVQNLLLNDLIANMSMISNVAANVYGVAPRIWLTDEPTNSPNAFAEAPKVPGDVGDVYVGLRFYTESLRQLILRQQTRPGLYNYGITSVYFHEFAHIAQHYLHTGAPMPTVQKELHADFLSGWGLGRIAVPIPSYDYDVIEAMRQLYEWGDFEYNSPQHHGTKCQRAKVFSLGLALGRKFPIGFARAPGENMGYVFQEGLRAVESVLRLGPLCGGEE
jgi:hypothetical protein